MQLIPKRLTSWVEAQVQPFAAHDGRTPPKTPLGFLLWQAQPFRVILILGALTATLVALFELGLIWYAGRLVDLMQTGRGTFWADHGWEVALAALLLLAIRPIVVGLNASVLFSGISTNLLPQTRWRSHTHLLGQPVTFFQNDFAGRLANRVMTTGVSTEDTVFLVFEAFWQAAAFAIATLILLGGMNPWLALPLAAWIIGYVGFLLIFAPRISKISEKASAANSRLTGRIVDSYTNIESVKLFAHAGREEAFGKTAMRRQRLRFGALMAAFADQQLAVSAFNSLAMAAVIGPALWIWSNGGLTTGEVAAAVAMALRLNTMTAWITWMTVRTFEHIGTIREGLESIAVPRTVLDKPKAPGLRIDQGAIRFDGLIHHYGKTTGGLNGVDLSIAGGERIGLVGPSGAGKSSLVNLLLRFRDVEQGRIEIDGQDISGVTQDSLRGAIGMVAQDSSLLHRSIRANILYGRPDATEAQMQDAARRAAADAFIQALEDPQGRTGFDAYVGERGVKLSGGQRQRVALARVILKDAPILILDEATSALDSEVEATILDTLYDMMEGKTVIAIAHRLSTIARMDRIVVMDDGRVAEIGTHDDLIARDGLYARLWSRQSGGFLGDA